MGTGYHDIKFVIPGITLSKAKFADDKFNKIYLY